MTYSVVLAARRSPIVPRNGALSKLSIEALAEPVLLAALSDAKLDRTEVDELIVANALGAGGNPARIIALQAGLPETVAGMTIDRQCIGGLDALLVGDALIKSGHCDVVIAGGAESYSRMPERYRTFADERPPERYEQAQFTPWPERDPDMAEAAFELAETLDISKSEQDAWAVQSHAKAMAAPIHQCVEVAGVTRDPFTRALNSKLCSRAPVVFGSISAANMSVSADGAAFLVMASANWASDRNLQGVRLLGGKTIGGNPVLPGLAPVAAIESLMETLSFSSADLNVIEVMEAFAAQAIACVRGAGLDPDKVNRWGGSLARGHPIGASGAVLATQLFHQLKVSGGLGLATIAAAGGLGSALVMNAG